MWLLCKCKNIYKSTKVAGIVRKTCPLCYRQGAIHKRHATIPVHSTPYSLGYHNSDRSGGKILVPSGHY
jgi:hypothetical protein